MSSLNNTQVDLRQSGNPPGVVMGRFMLTDHSEHACQVTELTDDGAVFLSTTVPLMGESIVAYLDDVGRIEAICGPVCPGGFSIRFAMQGTRLERLQQRIHGLKERGQSSSTENRRHDRFEISEKVSQITLPDGRVYTCEVLDISVSGAAIKSEVLPKVGTYLMLGKMRGRVVRYLEHGVGIEFVKHLEHAQLPTITGPSTLQSS